MSAHKPVLLAAAVLVLAGSLAGCASTSLEEKAPVAQKAATGDLVRTVRSADGKTEGEISGTPAPDSRFAKIKIGMELQQVVKLIGPYDGMYGSETAKRWIPFYLGNDARRGIALYKGDGCLTFTGGNFWSAGGNELIRIEVDPAGKCYQP
ncbi:hypothetical protein [Hydrogenophaga sp. RWCD_12]|uniref:hypothetical protein n=1 Tax=Hydrogenophaga sp. RWCD_12 TaxID=3391190 RepID=UPI0039850AA0